MTGTPKGWQRSATFLALQEKLKTGTQTDDFVRAQEVIEQPMQQVMQMAPTPDAVWRTAVKEHRLGSKNPV